VRTSQPNPFTSVVAHCQPEKRVEHLSGMTNSVPEELHSLTEQRASGLHEADVSAPAELVDVLFRRHYSVLLRPTANR
jgi:hypothetical protein